MITKYLREPHRTSVLHGNMSEGYIQGYSSRPTLVFLGDHTATDRSLYMGIELEVEVPEEEIEYGTCDRCGSECCDNTYDRATASNVWEDIYRSTGESVGGMVLAGNNLPYWATEDSSLYHGFEITTHPMTFNIASKLALWDKIDSLVSVGSLYDDPDSAGMHVHLSKAAFTRATLGRFLHAHKTTGVLWETVGGRDTDGHTYCDYNEGGTAPYAMREIISGNTDVSGRGAINLANHSTIEVRYPAGIANKLHVVRVLEMLQAYFDMIQHATTRDIGLHGMESIITWIDTHSDKYPTLAEYTHRLSLYNSYRMPRRMVEANLSDRITSAMYGKDKK